jgi:hypothetical protein
VRPPPIDVDYRELPTDPKERHEILVDIFGTYLMWAKRTALNITKQRVTSEDAREELGRLFRQVYDDAAGLTTEQREIAFQLADSAVSLFARLMLTTISGQGFDDELGPEHVFRYRLVMEICSAKDGQIEDEEIINRNGRKFFPEYWGRWINENKPKNSS